MKTKKAEGGRLGLPLAAAFFRLPAPPPALSLQPPPNRSVSRSTATAPPSERKRETLVPAPRPAPARRSYLPSPFFEVSALPFMVAGARVLRGDRTVAFESRGSGGGGWWKVEWWLGFAVLQGARPRGCV